MKQTTILSRYNAFGVSTLDQSVRVLERSPYVAARVSRTTRVDGVDESLGPDVFDEYLEEIRGISTTFTVESRFFMKPRHWSQKTYGTGDLWSLILWMNAMTHPREFNRKKISAPDTQANSIRELTDIYTAMRRDVHRTQLREEQNARAFLIQELA